MLCFLHAVCYQYVMYVVFLDVEPKKHPPNLQGSDFKRSQLFTHSSSHRNPVIGYSYKLQRKAQLGVPDQHQLRWHV